MVDASPRTPDHEVTELLLAVADGDAAALERLYACTRRTLYGIVQAVLGPRGDADDVLVEVYVRVWKRAASFDPARGRAASWLATLARNQAIDALRAAGRDLLAPRDDEEFDAFPMDAPGPLDQQLVSERAALVRDALGTLPDTERLAVEAVFFGGLTHTQAAAALGAPLGTLKSRVRTGLIRMRELLAATREESR